MRISRASIRRVLLPVTLIAFFGGGAVFLCSKKGPKTPESGLAQKTEAPLKLAERSPNGKFPLKEIIPPLLMPKEIPETIPVEPEPQKINNLKDFFAQLEDAPIPIVNSSDINIRVDKTGVCPGEQPGLNIAFYHNENLMGYLYLASDEDAPSYLDGQSLYGILNPQGRLIGFREIINFYKPTFSFLSLGGRTVKGEEEALEGNYIFGPESSLPLGRLNRKTNEFVDSQGEVAGRLQTERIYLPIYEAPNCEVVDLPIELIAATYLMFPTPEEFSAFAQDIQAQLISQ